MPVAQPTIAARLDRLPLTPLHVGILVLCTLGLATDIGEVALSNTFSALFLAPPYHATRADVSLLLAAVFAGGTVGAPFFGWLADRQGRRTVLQLALAVLVAGSLAAAASPNIGAMTLARFISGLALGAYPPLTAAYLSDILPPKRRGLLMMLCAAFAFLGAPVMILSIRWLTPVAPLGIEAWRWTLIGGAGLAAGTMALFYLVPESPRWLAAVGQQGDAAAGATRLEAVAGAPDLPLAEPRNSKQNAIAQSSDIAGDSLRDLAVEPRHWHRLALCAALYALGPWATIGFPLLSAAVMIQKGFHVSESLLFAGVSMFGPTIGITIAATFIDRIERRLALAICAIAMAGIGLAFAFGKELTPLIIIGAAFNLASAVYSAILAVYSAELFPTRLRATATSTAWAVGRLVSTFVPVVLLPLLASHGALGMFSLIAATLTASALLILAGPPGLTRCPID